MRSNPFVSVSLANGCGKTVLFLRTERCIDEYRARNCEKYLPDAVQPEDVLGLHEDGAKAQNCFGMNGFWLVLGGKFPGLGRKVAGGQGGESQIEVVSGGFVEDGLGEGGRLSRCSSGGGPEDD